MEYLQKDDIIFINKKTVQRHGGNFVPPENFLNESPLDYLLDAVQATMFEKPLYPEIHQKAGLYMYNIICNHVFQDGNKRTGLAAALLFLKLNGCKLKDKLSCISTNDSKQIPAKGNTTNEILTEFTLEVAAGKVELEECQGWFYENMEYGIPALVVLLDPES